MKKINTSLIVGIIWIIVSFLFFAIDKIGVGLVWLVVGIITLIRAIRLIKLNNKIDEMMEHSEETAGVTVRDEDCTKTETVIETIHPSEEVHTIYDEYSGYGYDVNKAFKPAKSHAGEVDLLCTYAPLDEYGQEGNLPCIAIQTDDEVYCAVEEYKESKTFEGAISIEPLEGNFMFRAKRDYYGDMMYFYGFEPEGVECWDKAGLCLVYPKEYVGTKEEEKLMQILDEAAKSFCKR